MKRVVGAVAGVSVLCAGLVVGQGGAPAGATTEAAAGLPQEQVSWGPCEPAPASGALGAVLGSLRGAARPAQPAPALRRAQPVECASVRVPLDPAVPYGQQITLALNRIRGTASRDHNHLGPLLVNPGGPGASGLKLAEYVAAKLPKDLAARFDVIGFDPRGVGASKPAVNCVDAKSYYAAPRPDNVPVTAADEGDLLVRARQYAEGCANRWGWFLPYLTTENTARDLEAIRQALGEEKLSFLGYSYGSYLGAVYASLFPDRVRRMILDSLVDPGNVWYEANLSQDYAFDRRHKEFLAWVARNHATYRIGDTAKAVEFAYYAMRQRLRERPAGGLIGPSELDDIYTVGGYSNQIWPKLAAAFSGYVRRGDVTGLTEAYQQHADHNAVQENSYAVYLGVQCRDAAWPRDWTRWRADTRRVHAAAPFLAWPNTVYNAPCLFWPEPGLTPPKVGATGQLPPILLVQSRRDAATPYQGAVNVRDLFPSARLLAEGGGNHGVSFAGNPCVDRQVADYLREGVLPMPRTAAREADLNCPGRKAPRAGVPAAAAAPAHAGLTRLLAPVR
ncbi:alpha/beta hydrolase [Acrocarpospora catenulata]|uniref:alpha/beta hydrolase n=1 Tax=Acrocarpospora catenulata TaxID=2836182 RepID=UPI001BDAB45E|nr:alpha/beta hydrolase [Acrocarpospora catenulata]